MELKIKSDVNALNTGEEQFMKKLWLLHFTLNTKQT